MGLCSVLTPNPNLVLLLRGFENELTEVSLFVSLQDQCDRIRFETNANEQWLDEKRCERIETSAERFFLPFVFLTLHCDRLETR